MVACCGHPDTDLAPQQGLAEVERLAERPLATLGRGDALRWLDDVSPAVGAAIYRLAQESITNARRHGRHATRVTVAVAGGQDEVRLTVDDDGSAGASAPAGSGLVGMRERATLLGGTFQAGPTADRGWRVEAVLPRSGVRPRSGATRSEASRSGASR